MLHERLEAYACLTEEALGRYLPETDCAQKRILEAGRYSLLGGGKRLRPALMMEFYRLCGGSPEDILPFACALEMIHTYSLIHDDLPCMDDDDLRRGRPTSHKMFGEAMAVLAGDMLLNRAFELMLNEPCPNVEPGNAFAAAGLIARMSGAFGMIGGQVLDMELEEKRESALVEPMIELKTGALFVAACGAGCQLAGANETLKNASAAYARAIGLVFQLRDDLLDLEGDAEKLGKATGADARQHKLTYVSQNGAAHTRERIALETKIALQCAEQFEDRAFLCELAKWLAQRDH